MRSCHCGECMSGQMRELACRYDTVLTVPWCQVQNSTQGTSPSKAFELRIWPVNLASAAFVQCVSRVCGTRTGSSWHASSSSSSSVKRVTLGAHVPWPTSSLRTTGCASHASSSKRLKLTLVVSRTTSSSGKRVKMERGSS